MGKNVVVVENNVVRVASARRLRAAVEAMREEPRRANMGDWITIVHPDERPPFCETRSRYLKSSEIPPCGTIGCLAGWIVLLSPSLRRAAPELLKGKWGEQSTSIPNMASSVLQQGVDWESLFFPSRWPWKFVSRLQSYNPGTKKYVEVIARRVEFFIKYGE